MRARARVCVCVRARARVCVCVCVSDSLPTGTTNQAFNAFSAWRLYCLAWVQTFNLALDRQYMYITRMESKVERHAYYENA